MTNQHGAPEALRFTKKPVTIEAIQWTGKNLREVITFTDGPPDTRSTHAGMAWEAYADLVARDGLKIYTLEGKMLANPGDWIIRGVKGEYYPCKPDIFEATYSPATLVEAQQPATCGNTPYDEGPFTLAQQPIPSTAAEHGDGFMEAINEMDGLHPFQAAPQPSPSATKRICNTCQGTGIVKGLHNWGSGGTREEKCWNCHEAPQPDPTAQANSQPAHQRDTGYPPLPECDATTISLGAVWDRHSMRAYVDADRKARAQPAPVVVDRDRIREIFMAHGFTVKEGQTDLKQYVYDAADALLRAARAQADSVPPMTATGTRPKPVTDVDVRNMSARVISGQAEEDELLEFFARLAPPHPVHIAAAPAPPTHAADSVLEDAGGANWQDISTAPKDGTRFVAVGNNYGLYSEPQHTCIAQWFRGCWMDVSEWNETSELKYLTHWMPLLPLPGNAARKQK